MSFGDIRNLASVLLKGNRLIMTVGYVLSFVTWTIVTQLFVTIIGTGSIFSILEPILNGWQGFQIEFLIIPILFGILFILADLLHMSYRWFGLDLADYRKERLEVKYIFQGFRDGYFKKLFLLVFTRAALVLLWSILFILPGLWKAYNYSQAANILKDQPELSVLEALKRSEEMMKGKWGTYIALQLSFIPWYLIPITLYILFIVNNLEEIAIGIEMGVEGIELVFGMLFGVLFILGLLLLFFSFFVEPKKMVAKQIFYRDLTSSINENAYDSYEKNLLKKQGMLR